MRLDSRRPSFHGGRSVKSSGTKKDFHSILVVSFILDLVCWRFRKLAAIIFYLECVWAFFDATWLMNFNFGALRVILDSARMIAAVTFFSVDAKPSIFISAASVGITCLSSYLVADRDGDFGTLGLISSMLTVFIYAAVFWAYLMRDAHREAILARALTERDDLLEGLSDKSQQTLFIDRS